MDKALNYLSLARKAGRAELGEEPVNAATRNLHGFLVLVSSDASDHTWRRAQSFVAGTNQQCLRLPHTKEQMGQATGRQSLAIAAITDPALALALVQALGEPERYGAVLEALENRVSRVRQRQKEAKAHLKNKKMGKSSPAAQKKEH